ncbi:hypothetical protein U9M48_029437 [Paspalum notatum var. saurae]|uniref:Uncharacterized protein n=1 Tax=Paspalum notatum var. saurae TaxID=547442 RepID=A0AAQ3TXV5_PASNO
MEMKGPFPKRMLRTGAFTTRHFNQDLNFQVVYEDPVTRREVRRLLWNVKPKGIVQLINNPPPAAPTNDHDPQSIIAAEQAASFRASAPSGHPGPAATFWLCARGAGAAAGDAGGESRQRRSSLATAATRSSSAAAAGGLLRDGARAKATWRSSASAVVMVLPSRRTSSPTASAQRPQTQRPRYSARTAAMYAGVHSSVKPQHSHLAASTSMVGRLPPSLLVASCLAAAAASAAHGRTYVRRGSVSHTTAHHTCSISSSSLSLPLLLPDGVGRRHGRRRGAVAAAALLARDGCDDDGGFGGGCGWCHRRRATDGSLLLLLLRNPGC